MTRSELEKKTIAALRALAKERDIRLRAALKKGEIVELLLKGLASSEAERGPAAPSQKDGILRVKAEEARGARLPADAGEERSGSLPTSPVEKNVIAPPSFAEIPRWSYNDHSHAPSEYGANYIVALVRDPFWIYTYWEALPDALGEANRKIADPDARLTLRVYDVTDGGALNLFWDIEIFHRIGNWYIDVGRPDRTYLVDIGVKSRTGAFATIARSNAALTPPAGPSSRLDEEWWIVEDFEPTAVVAFDEGRRLPIEALEREVRTVLASNLFSLTGSVSSYALLKR